MFVKKNIIRIHLFRKYDKNGFIPVHTQRNMRYIFITPTCNKNESYNQGANRAIARRSGPQLRIIDISWQ